MKKWIITAGIAGFTGVALGAFGGHGLKSIAAPEMVDIYKIGTNYHLFHAIVILIFALWGNARFNNALLFFTAGIILFSFSLYLYALTGITMLTFITPLGGLCFLAGWALVTIKGIQDKA